jgi:hypothetical protein
VPNAVKGKFDLRAKYNADPFKVTVKPATFVIK